ncbi:PoNi-like cognate immunity protein [Chryseobacterium foetidum]|uniref:PoNi-like cognate immunity protein n=1 Tax=Chryseobacterium foetidum TaxID=2951057 RepID=UPI0021C6D5D1|nr:PoNi-like cognate immunity protein [Chryseobacterium foetidum]
MGLFGNLFGLKNQQNINKKNEENEIPKEINELKSRDINQSSQYFYNFLERIKPNSDRILSAYAESKKSNNERGIKNSTRGLSEGIYTKPSIWYSMGVTIDKDWQVYYRDYIKYYQERINKDLINGSYQFSLKILSIGILLRIEKDVFKKISERYVEEGYEDYILDRLIHSQYPSHPISTELQFPAEIYIQKLAQILKSSSVQESETLAKESLEKYFYTKENLQTSYDSHKTDFYSGYWAWEIAAIVKILALDDSSFKDNQYYPYDMVHWLNKIK